MIYIRYPDILNETAVNNITIQVIRHNNYLSRGDYCHIYDIKSVKVINIEHNIFTNRIFITIGKKYG